MFPKPRFQARTVWTRRTIAERLVLRAARESMNPMPGQTALVIAATVSVSMVFSLGTDLNEKFV